ncbi:MAG: hypothetical protein IID18_09550 [Nitrospinae bacterium]|nr:hypothetical protein [Nitrospinota bacterium]
MSPKETSRRKIGKASIPTPVYPEHGGNPARMAQLAGVGPGEIIDFSANINPLGPPPGVLSTLSRTDYEIRNYPDS